MDEMPRDRYFETTNGKVHDHKFLGGPYGNGKSNVYKKAPALYNVNYVKDHAEKVSVEHVISLAKQYAYQLYTHTHTKMENSQTYLLAYLHIG